MIRFLFLLLIALVTTGSESSAQRIIVGTYNIRMLTDADTGNLWVNRAPIVSALIRFHQFDIFGTQEGFRSQLNDIQRSLPEFTYYGAGRDDGKEAGEHSAIFFRKDRFRLLDKGDFWLSKTPDQPSLGWDAKCCKRLCTWVKLEDQQTGKRFFFFNAHYDHEGEIAKLESSKLILQRINNISGLDPVIFSGDLNTSRDSKPYLVISGSKLLTDTYTKTNFPYAVNGTFNGFGRTVKNTAVIDHIFSTDHFLVERWGILSDSYFGKYPSDHFPVLAQVVFKN